MEIEIIGIRNRDFQTGPLWFNGPANFTAMAARDRRVLIKMVDTRDDRIWELERALLETARAAYGFHPSIGWPAGLAELLMAGSVPAGTADRREPIRLAINAAIDEVVR